MREPFILHPPEARGGNDRQLREVIGQRSSPAQMLTELCCMLANLGSTDQQLERPAKSPPPSGNNQIVNSALGLGHLRVSDFMITAIDASFLPGSSSPRRPCSMRMRG